MENIVNFLPSLVTIRRQKTGYRKLVAPAVLKSAHTSYYDTYH